MSFMSCSKPISSAWLADTAKIFTSSAKLSKEQWLFSRWQQIDQNARVLWVTGPPSVLVDPSRVRIIAAQTRVA